MSAAAISVSITLGIVAVAATIGFLAGVRRKMDLEQWTVGGRGFGALLIFLLMAGEVYTTFAFLGASGWAYSRGGPTLYVLAYLTLSYVVSFFILPAIWAAGRKYGVSFRWRCVNGLAERILGTEAQSCAARASWT